jgi:protein gp37
MAMWDPWRGCHKISLGCDNCYIHMGDKKRNVDTNIIKKTDKFYKPIEKLKNGNYKIKSGSTVYVCFSSDFLLEEADEWRKECFKMIKERSDLNFIFLTKRINRFLMVIPSDWGLGYPNVTVGVSVSNQQMVDDNISKLVELPIKHKIIILQPLLEKVNIVPYLSKDIKVVVGGEYGKNARAFNYDWVLNIREQCIKHKTPFEFRQCGSKFIKEGIQYNLAYRELSLQAKKANINIGKYE